MADQPDDGSVPQLGGTPEGRIQRYFCVDDEECRAFARISKEAKVIKRESTEILVMGEPVKGWIVELLVPATDGVVRMNPIDKS